MILKKRKTVSRLFDPKKMLLSENSSFPTREAYKSLRTNVLFSLPGSDSKCIGVVSANRGEGKSTIAINLAISFAQANKKVIVVDCDMRLPTVAAKIGIEAKPGLSNYLAGSDDIQSHLIQRVSEYGIDVLASGDIPPDPTALLGSQQMDNLIVLLKEYYDYVILDFPPVTIVTDAVILAKQVDGYLVVVRHNLSEFKKLKETFRQLEFSEAKVLGVVYNGKGSRGKGYYRKSGGYYYYDDYYQKTPAGDHAKSDKEASMHPNE